MTIYDKGLLRAMKAAYKDEGYDVALSDGYMIIQTKGWGVRMHTELVPNSVKSLIVLHNGSMPRKDSAVHVAKGECGDVFLDMVATFFEELANDYTASGGLAIKPTRLTFDGKRVWQLTDKLDVRLVDVDDQQIMLTLYGEKVNTQLIGNTIYSRLAYGALFIHAEKGLPEDRHLMQHLSGMQWIPVELA